ncbi:MAG TPA: ATP-binding protein [Candidatus Omnitrophota bacterium]|nr:ATP-binding protein [Candidatus Omnitrophota bacterium]HRY86071.1 ATP-binding protein [Candidatus Omnitrophota bacterium]
MFIKREALMAELGSSVRRSRITALLGPRQCGKTTLAKHFFRGHSGKTAYYDLENQEDAALLKNPQTVLAADKGLIVIDEIQRRPDLFPVLRVLADRKPLPAKFLILGSASPELIRKSSESLAGRVEFIEMNGFSLGEVGPSKQDALWLRGGMPGSFLARSMKDSQEWRENFIRTFVERDVPQMGFQFPSAAVRRFWQMIAHVHGQIWNGSEIGASLGVAHTTSRRYLDLLTGAYVVRQLQPWYENAGKRLVKSPKIYFRDSGLLHQFLKIGSLRDLLAHPKAGSSWEGFALEQVLSRLGERDSFFWATHAGAELDLLLLRQGKKWGFEFKFTESPEVTKSMRIALHDLKLERLHVIYPGEKAVRLDKKVELVGLKNLSSVKI